MRIRLRITAIVVVSMTAVTDVVADPWSRPAVSVGPADLLAAESAFQLTSATRIGDVVTLEWVIAPGYYLYRKRLSFEPVMAGKTRVGPAELPVGQTLHDAHFGDVQVYREILSARLPLTPANAPLPQLRVRFQGCADAGVCYPPVTRVVNVDAASG